METSLRPMEESDARAVARLEREAYHPLGLEWYALTESAAAVLAVNPSFVTLVAEDCHKVVLGWVCYTPGKADNVVRVAGLAVDRPWRRTGIGRQLMRCPLARCRQDTDLTLRVEFPEALLPGPGYFFARLGLRPPEGRAFLEKLGGDTNYLALEYRAVVRAADLKRRKVRE